MIIFSVFPSGSGWKLNSIWPPRTERSKRHSEDVFFIPYRPVGALQAPEFLNNFFPLFSHLSVNVQNACLGRQLLVLVPQILYLARCQIDGRLFDLSDEGTDCEPFCKINSLKTGNDAKKLWL